MWEKGKHILHTNNKALIYIYYFKWITSKKILEIIIYFHLIHVENVYCKRDLWINKSYCLSDEWMKVNNRENICEFIQGFEKCWSFQFIVKAFPATAGKKSTEYEVNMKPFAKYSSFWQTTLWTFSWTEQLQHQQRVQWWLEKIITIISILLLNTCYIISSFFWFLLVCSLAFSLLYVSYIWTSCNFQYLCLLHFCVHFYKWK